MTTLVSRLEKLEKDLQLLSAMQHLLVSSDGNLNSLSNPDDSESDIPTRDTPINQIVKVPMKRNQKTKVFASSLQKQNGENYSTKSDNGNVEIEKVTSKDSIQKFSEMEDKLAKIECQLTIDGIPKFGSEEYQKDMEAQFQKKEEELQREKNCKNGLLRLTLQLKGQMQEKEGQTSNLENRIAHLKTEKIKIMEDVENLKIKTENLETNFYELLENHKTLIEENERLMKDLAKLEIEKKETQRENEFKEQSSRKQEEKFINQLNQLVAKCAHIDQLRQTTSTENKQLNDTLNDKNDELHQLQAKCFKLEADHERAIVLHDCEMNKLRLELESQTETVNQKITSCHNILSQTKNIFLKLSSEKHEVERCLSFEIDSKAILNSKFVECVQKIKEADQTKKVEFQDLKSTINEKEESIEKIKRKYHDHQRMNSKLKLENEELVKRVKENYEKFSIEVKRFEEYKSHDEGENANLKKELKNTRDNLLILQKISEDQIHSIQKLKADVEEYRGKEFFLKNQLRDAEDALEVSKKEIKIGSDRLVEQEDDIEYLQQKLIGMEENLQKHNCEDFIESRCKEKLRKLETQVKLRYKEWEGSSEVMRRERDKALTAAKRAVNKVIDMKSEYETQILELQSQMKNDASRALTQSRREVLDKTQQIQHLENELEKIRQDSSLSQKSHLQKIHQLQTALNICVGTFSQPHQQHQHQHPTIPQPFNDNAGNLHSFGSMFF